MFTLENTLNSNNIKEFDVNFSTGFLPEKEPLIRLTDPYFQKWEVLMDNLEELIEKEVIQNEIEKLEILDISKLKDKESFRRAYVILSFLGQSYVWSSKKPKLALPKCIAIPWCKISDILGLKPVCCNATVCLWNFKKINSAGEFNVDNLTTINNFTNTDDENWFYLITTGIEALGGPLIKSIFNTIDFVDQKNQGAIEKELMNILNIMREMCTLLSRMKERCSPMIFYWRIRTYLAGWKNMQIAGLPEQGLFYEGVDDETSPQNNSIFEGKKGCYKKLSGGSAAQSAIIQVLDIFFGVLHFPTEFSARAINKNSLNVETKTKGNQFLLNMREYMPKSHHSFLIELEKISNLRVYLQNNYIESLAQLYNLCILELKHFRDVHIQLVTNYIIIPSKKQFSLPIEPTQTPFKIKARNNSLPLPQIISSPSSSSLTTSPNIKTPDDISHDVFVSQHDDPLSSFDFKPLGIAKSLDPSDKIMGTGGTDLLPFLKQIRDETIQSSLI